MSYLNFIECIYLDNGMFTVLNVDILNIEKYNIFLNLILK